MMCSSQGLRLLAPQGQPADFTRPCYHDLAFPITRRQSAGAENASMTYGYTQAYHG